MKNTILLPVIFIAVFVLSRIPGLLPPDFSAAYALALCAGVYFRGAIAWWLPLAVMAVTDALLSYFCYHVSPFRWELLLNYALYAGLIGLGRILGCRAAFWKLLLGGVLGAALFYLLTNTLSWLLDSGYARTVAGWLQALFTGLPGYPPSWEFFRNTFAAGGLFTALFAGAAKLAAAESPADKTAGAPDPKDEPTDEPAPS